METMSLEDLKTVWFSELVLSAEAKYHIDNAEEKRRRKLAGGRKKANDAWTLLNESWARFQKGKSR